MRLKAVVRTAAQGSAVLAVMAGMSAVAGQLPEVPAEAKAGECYAKVMVPAQYKSEEQEIVIQEASEKIEIIPAETEWVEDKIMVKPAVKKLVSVEPVFEEVEKQIMLEPAQTEWVYGSIEGKKRASTLFVEGAVRTGLPVDEAQFGQCYAEYLLPAKYETSEEEIVIREASHRFEIIPPKYEWVEEKVLVQEASVKLVQTPAEYEKVEEKLLVKPATKAWKKGRGLVERIDNDTGDIMCLVEVPAVYKTVVKQVMKKPPSVQQVEVPAKYEVQKVQKLVSPATHAQVAIPEVKKTINKRKKLSDERVIWSLADEAVKEGKKTGRVLCKREIPAKMETVKLSKMTAAARTQEVDVPAEYVAVKRLKVVKAAMEKRIEVPAKVEKIVRRVKVSDSRLDWKPVLCETNTNPDLIRRLQMALNGAGYPAGGVDGVIGAATLSAVEKFQKDKNLPRGGLTLKTLEALKVTF